MNDYEEQTMTRPVALVTNDDGIDSFFFTELVTALTAHFDVCIVAPAKEQSWASRAFSRFTPVTVEAREGFPRRVFVTTAGAPQLFDLLDE